MKYSILVKFLVICRLVAIIVALIFTIKSDFNAVWFLWGFVSLTYMIKEAKADEEKRIEKK